MAQLRGKPLLIVVLATLSGAAAGLGGYTFVYARGASYLGNDPRTCANCHIMRDHLDAWNKSSHHAVATCNDCHTPANFVGKYAVKAENGLRHSIAFTSGNFPEPLQIHAASREVAEENCRRCHASMVAVIDRPEADVHGDRLSCTRCHQHVGHPR